MFTLPTFAEKILEFIEVVILSNETCISIKLHESEAIGKKICIGSGPGLTVDIFVSCTEVVTSMVFINKIISLKTTVIITKLY